MHLSFDLCDRQPSVEAALQLLLQHYDHDASPPLSPTRDVLAKLAELARSDSYEGDLGQVLAAEKSGHAAFREMLSTNRITHLDRYIDGAGARTAPPVPAGAGKRFVSGADS